MAAAAFRTAVLALACTTIAADARTFENTRWHVTAINGHSTPASGDYSIQFKDGQVSGRFGCNGWGGSYAVSGSTITASQIRSTMMACPDPAMSFESQGLAVLQRPMRWSSAGNKVTLTSGAGSIALERQP